MASPDHTGNTLDDQANGTAVPFLESSIDRPRDISFVIDEMIAMSRDASDPLYRRVNRHAIGVTGHSFGGFTSLAMAAGYDGSGLPPIPDFPVFEPDPRVRAIAPIAPASGLLSDAELAGIGVPTLVVGGTLDVTTPIDPQSTRPFALVAGDLVRADLTGAGHFSFTNTCDVVDVLLATGVPLPIVIDLLGNAYEEGCAPELLPIDEATRLTTLYVVAFFRKVLAWEGEFGFFLTPKYADRNEPDVTVFDKKAPRPPKPGK
ncbi:MAG: hypothetical protein MJE66_09705 [Proteobacteria bacterium]|nr:hypothetical protein [Pseudomonadota bacterium]